ncbi:MscL family protein [Nonomuraea sp. NPDC003804]|uniref:MscL family protein n=1 Tax=Nonomuraea sp. NPDC003804 TaxID=3154547 RepID=UPI0033BA7BC3
MGGFKKFLLRGNIVELAVAVIVGATFSGLVQALVADLITPLIGAITGGREPDFAQYSFTVNGSEFRVPVAAGRCAHCTVELVPESEKPQV